jgi:hypothetical protein
MNLLPTLDLTALGNGLQNALDLLANAGFVCTTPEEINKFAVFCAITGAAIAILCQFTYGKMREYLQQRIDEANARMKKGSLK